MAALEKLEERVKDAMSDAYNALRQSRPDVADVVDFNKVGQWLVLFIVSVDGHSDRIYRDFHSQLRWADGVLHEPEES